MSPGTGDALEEEPGSKELESLRAFVAAFPRTFMTYFRLFVLGVCSAVLLWLGVRQKDGRAVFLALGAIFLVMTLVATYHLWYIVFKACVYAGKLAANYLRGRFTLTVYELGFTMRPPRYRIHVKCDPKCQTGTAKRCTVCEDVIRTSALLTGTWWIFTRCVEVHKHHDVAGLLTSSDSCSLCRMIRDALVEPMSLTVSMGQIELYIREDRLSLSPPLTILSICIRDNHAFLEPPAILMRDMKTQNKAMPSLIVSQGRECLDQKEM